MNNNDWLSVEESLPAQTEHILVCIERKNTDSKVSFISLGMYMQEHEKLPKRWYWYELENIEHPDSDYYLYQADSPIDERVTHWMQLPKLPKGDNYDS